MSWLLVIVLYMNGDVRLYTPLVNFQLLSTCHEQRDYVRYQMEVAYPGDVDYELRCVRYEEPASVPDGPNVKEIT